MLGFLENVLIEDLKEVLVVGDGRVNNSFASRDVARGFAFLSLPLMNLIVVYVFKQ